MKKNLVITLIVVGLLIPAFFIFRGNPPIKIDWFDTNYLNLTAGYELTMLLLSFAVILITGLQTRFQSLKLLSISKIDGEVRPEPWIGITEKNKDSWKKLGLSMTIIVSIVTGVVLYFQVYSKGLIQPFTVGNFLLVVLLALINSFVEEVVFRHTFASIVEYHEMSPYVSQGLSALIFGIGHYFGSPGGIPGVLMAGYLGWFASKSIHETKGFFWAWMIHFVQDIIIMTGAYLTLG